MNMEWRYGGIGIRSIFKKCHSKGYAGSSPAIATTLQRKQMFIARKSLSSGIVRTKDIPVTIEQLASYENGATVEKAFPRLNLIHREFIMTGMTRSEWLETFGIEDNSYGRNQVAPN